MGHLLFFHLTMKSVKVQTRSPPLLLQHLAQRLAWTKSFISVSGRNSRTHLRVLLPVLL